MSPGFDSGILQYTPKGAYYEGKDEQFEQVKSMWAEIFNHDRSLFSLVSVLNGTGFSKGAMGHMLLSNPVKEGTGMDIVPDGLDADFERKIILYNLYKLSETNMARAIKNLLMLVGEDLHSRVNNSRTRSIILEFIFNRPNDELDELAVNFKTKLAKLVRHALGKQDLYKIINDGTDLFNKKIGRYNNMAYPIICHLFNIMPKYLIDSINPYFPKVENYWKAKEAAAKGNIEEFKKLIKILPWRVCMGFKNTYKLPIENSEILGEGKMSKKEELTTEAAVKRSGAKTRSINYETQDLYDLWKALYFKASTGDNSNLDKITAAIQTQVRKLDKLNFGESTSVIIDASHSMYGSDERPMHPILTAICISLMIENTDNVNIVGGNWKIINDSDHQVVFPANSTPLWKGLVDAIISGSKHIVIISDGYENSVKGMVNHVYKHFKAQGKEFNLYHINPVLSVEAKTGTSRRLTEDVKPISVTSYKYLETEYIFNQLIENTESVKRVLISKFQKLIGG